MRDGGFPLLIHTGDFCKAFQHDGETLHTYTVCAPINADKAFRWSLGFRKQ